MPAIRGNRLTDATIKEGTLRVIDADGNVLVEIGKLEDGEYGISISSPDLGNVLKADSNGMAIPFYSSPFRAVATAGSILVAGTSFQVVYTTLVEKMQWDAVRVRVPAVCDVGETGEVRLSCSQTEAVTSPRSVTSTAGDRNFQWLHGVPPDPADAPIRINVEARQVTGSGGVRVWPPSAGAVYYRGALMTPPATTTGI